MFVKTVKTSRGNSSLINLNNIGAITMDSRGRHISTSDGTTLISGLSPEDLEVRYNDICAALIKGDVVVYDCNEPVSASKAPRAKTAAKSSTTKE